MKLIKKNMVANFAGNMWQTLIGLLFIPLYMKFLGMEASFGSVEPGKIANLLLLSANPLEDIRNTRKISVVIANGQIFDRAALDRILKQVEAAAKRQ